MLVHAAGAARARFCLALLVAAGFALLAGCWWLEPATARAEEGGVSIVCIEEDWELVVLNPDPDTQAPQVTCVISPVGNADSVYSVLDLNLRTQPDVRPGGLQIQVWDGEEVLSSAKSHSGTLLEHENETITWTTTMTLDQGKVRFQIDNGHGDSWGSFGGGDSLKVSRSVDLANLNGYNSSVSVANSGVGFAANRVTSLVLKRVRAYTADGQVVEDSQPKTVYPHD